MLLIEDDEPFRKSLAKLLRDNGYAPREAKSGKTGAAEAFKNPPELVILDLQLPGRRGEEVCSTLKSDLRTAGTPILILTGEDREGLEIACLDLGADDYLTKPVRPDLLLARCRALLRRTAKGAGPDRPEIRLGDLRLDYAGKTAFLGNRLIAHLTPREFEVLYDLALHHPQARDRATLYRELWGAEPPSEGSLKTVEVHVRRIRLKMGWEPDEWLVRVAGRGYCLAPAKGGRPNP